MIKVISGTLIFCLLSLQSPGDFIKSERECEGFVGPVKNSLEEWSPVSGYPYPSTTRCRSRAHVYDKDGRLFQYSYFTGACGSDENREHYTYDLGGNRTSRTEEILGKNSQPPPPPLSQPGAMIGPAVRGFPKTILIYDAKGMITEKANFRIDGKPTYKTTYSYDEKGRLQEMQVIHSAGNRYRWTYKYEGENRFPESELSFAGYGNNPSSTVTYTDYEFNPQGDWIKRKETSKETTGRTTVSIHYRSIEYYTAKK